MLDEIDRQADSISRRFRAYDQAVLQRLEDLAELMNVEVHYGGITGAAARLTMGPQGFVLRVNERDRGTPSGRFSIGHELGHYWLHRHHSTGTRCTESDMRRWHRSGKLETEANAFAASFLLPSLLMHERLDEREPSLDLVRGIASEFDVSLTASAIRLVRLHEEPCAVVVATAGTVDFVVRGEDFWPWIDDGVPLHPGTLAFDCHRELRNIHPTQEAVPAFSWCSSPLLQSEKLEVLEHTHYSRRLKRSLSLLWARDLPLEDEASEEADDETTHQHW